ncbi:MAG: hypothetical protein ACD_4C00125G0009 [uncultured bacterium (gcode 4)]|uniref:Uncharacterized protein n=1 Tax=uncultured bacterium (gcode 4) TaxID=1234023 RepID=K2F704_9BACT|nr:MAG: hypothetical protein ACD_4C00125G0009 [uncultured bacterium (gcode 4)]
MDTFLNQGFQEYPKDKDLVNELLELDFKKRFPKFPDLKILLNRKIEEFFNNMKVRFIEEEFDLETRDEEKSKYFLKLLTEEKVIISEASQKIVEIIFYDFFYEKNLSNDEYSSAKNYELLVNEYSNHLIKNKFNDLLDQQNFSRLRFFLIENSFESLIFSVQERFWKLFCWV